MLHGSECTLNVLFIGSQEVLNSGASGVFVGGVNLMALVGLTNYIKQLD